MSDTYTPAVSYAANNPSIPFVMKINFVYEDGRVFRYFCFKLEDELNNYWDILKECQNPPENKEETKEETTYRHKRFNNYKKSIRNLWDELLLDNLTLEDIAQNPERLNESIHLFCRDWYQREFLPKDYSLRKAFRVDLDRAIYLSDKETKVVEELRDDDWLFELWEERGIPKLSGVIFKANYKKSRGRVE